MNKKIFLTLSFSFALLICTAQTRTKTSAAKAAIPSMQAVSLKTVHPWAGKRVAYIGDSVTDPNNDATNKRYYDYLKEWLGIEPFIYAVSGHKWSEIPGHTDKLFKDHGQNVDAIIIFMGTNDYLAGVPIGHFYTQKLDKVVYALGQEQQVTKRMHRTLCMGDSTVCARINTALSKLKTVYPTKQIVILTPIHRSYAYFGSTNVQPDESYQNVIDRWFDEYVNTIKEAGSVWSVPVIDLYSLSGLYPNLKSNDKYFHNAETDRLHPNAEGHKRIAKTLMYQLLTLPCDLE